MHCDPFSGSGNWYKGNLHTHSTVSKGMLTPEQLKTLYRQHGYAFLALTDHTIYRYHSELNDPDFLFWPGAEPKTVSYQSPDSPGFCPHYHYLALQDENAVWNAATRPHFVDGEAIEKSFCDRSELQKAAQERINLLRAAGNLVTVNHPVWSRLYLEDLLALDGYFAMEIYNTHSAIDGHDCGEASLLWDMLLRRGKRVFAIATDDCHMKNKSTKPASIFQPDDPGCDACGGFVCVKADSLTVDALARAMKTGRFYSSTGPTLTGFSVQDGLVRMDCSPVQRIDFVTYERRGGAIAAHGDTLTHGEYRLHGDELYVRVQCTQRDGSRLWTNPIFLSDLH